MHKKLYIYASIAVGAILVVAVGIFFRNPIRRVLNPLLSRFDTSQSRLAIQFIDHTNNNYDYVLTENFPYHEEYFSFLHNSPLYSRTVTINITADQTNARAKNLRGQEIISGFTFTNTDTTTDVELYISPELGDDKKVYEINNTLLIALLHASEEIKMSQANGEYFADIQTANQLTHKIMIESYDTNRYALRRK